MSFGVAFALLFLVSMVHQKLRLRYVLSRILVIAGVVGAVAFESGDILRRVYQSDPGAVKFRWDMIYAALDMIKAHPIFGVGLNTFVAHFPDYSNPPGVEAVNAQYGQLWPVVHDSYLITWTEQGTAGFVFLMALYGGVLWTAAHTARRLVDDRVYAINLGAGCGVVGIMIDGFGSFFIDESASVRVFFLVVGIIYAASYWTRINAPLRASVKAAPEKAPVTHAPVPA
jgi:O-antigen ligase